MVHRSQLQRYALIVAGVVHFRVIFDMLVQPSHLTFVTGFFSIAIYLTILSPGLILNILSYWTNNRVLTLLAALAYFNSSLYLSVVMMWLIIPGGLCFYAFIGMRKRRPENDPDLIK